MNPENDLPALDLEFVRRQFPFFETELAKHWAFFDNAGGTFPCGAVVDRLTRFYRQNKVQPYTHNAVAAAASEQMGAGRSVIAALLGVPETTLTLGPSTTQNVNTLSTACGAFLEPGDEILVSGQDHEANIGGWERAAQRTGAVLRFWPTNPETGELELTVLEICLNGEDEDHQRDPQLQHHRNRQSDPRDRSGGAWCWRQGSDRRCLVCAARVARRAVDRGGRLCVQHLQDVRDASGGAVCRA